MEIGDAYKLLAIVLIIGMGLGTLYKNSKKSKKQ